MNKENIYLILAHNIKKYRNICSLTQEELAEKANLHPSYIGQIERGTKKISILTLQKISKALNTNISLLLSEKNITEINQKSKYKKLNLLLDEISYPEKKEVISIIYKLIKIILKQRKTFKS